MRILIVEDESEIAQNTKKLLESEKYLVNITTSIAEAEEELDINKFDVIILDIMLGDGSGINFCKKIRKNGNTTPVIMLTAKSRLDDKVEGLDSGADDYLTKPFLKKELLSRIKALIRRSHGKSISPIIKIGNVSVNTNSKQVSINKENINLSPKEYQLLEYLSLNPDIAIDRLTLLENVWGEDVDEFSNTVDVHIRYIRKKLGKEAEIIKTVKGKGYMVCKN